MIFETYFIHVLFIFLLLYNIVFNVDPDDYINFVEERS